MSTIKKIGPNLIPINPTYLGNISYITEAYNTSVGNSLILHNAFEDPVDYNISRDVYSVLTNYKNYSGIFNNIREETIGAGTTSLSALAVNDFIDAELLSAIAETGTIDGASNTTDILGFSESSENIEASDIIPVYSFNSTVSFRDVYWVELSGVLDTDSEPSELTNDHYFYFKFLDSIKCNIKKSDADGDKFLTYSPSSSSLSFTEVEDVTNSRFTYSYNSSNSTIMVITQGGSLGVGNTGEITITPLSSASLSSEIQSNILNIDYKNELDKEELVKNSFLSLYRNKNDIDVEHDVDNCHLITHNYESALDKNSNCIPLKNNVSVDGSYSLINVKGSSAHRDYSSINSGIRGDSGYTNFINSYNTNQFKIEFASDKQTYFNVPFELDGYSQINVNDCKLIENGAIGGNSPLNSDKLYKRRYEYEKFKNTGQTSDVDNGQYLCTWLWYNPLRPSQSVWIDRYYNPDRVTQLDALSVEGWNAIKDLDSFSRTHGLGQPYSDYFAEFDKEIGVFDVESKLTIQPNVLYMYERIGKQVSQSLDSENDNFILAEVSNKEMNFSEYEIITTTETSNDEDFSISLVLDNFSVDTFVGNKIFGNNTMSLTVDRYFSPFRASVSGSVIRFYDFDYNEVTSLDLSSDISDVVFTDDYTTLFIEVDNGEIYTVENLDFISNVSSALTSVTVNDMQYSNNALIYLDDSGNYFELNLNTDVSIPKGTGDIGDDLLLVYNEEYSSYTGDYIDYTNDGTPYVLSSNSILYNNIESPIISGDVIKDIEVDKDDIIYVLKDDSLYKIDNSFLTKTLSSVSISSFNTLKYVNMGRYLRNGELIEYIDVTDTDNVSSTKIHRFDKDLNSLGVIDTSIQGSPIKASNTFSTKFLEKNLELDITLFNIFNYIKVGNIRLEIPKRFVEQDDRCIINVVFSNKYGSINVYCNGELLDIFKFDDNKYYFSNTLRDTKLFISASNYNGEETVSNTVLSSNNDMISGNFTLTDFKIHDKYYDYFDVINYNRIYRATSSNSMVIPIKTRAYIEEISGFYIQNKNLRKSEYGSIRIKGTDLTEAMKTDVKSKIDETFVNTFVNLRVSDTIIE